VTRSQRLAEIAERVKARHDDPQFQANAQRLARESAAFQEEQEAYYRRGFLLACRVPEEVWPLLDSPGVTEAIAAAQEVIAGNSLAPDGKPPRFLTLAGPVGRGKTVALAWCVFQRGGRYFTAQEMVAAGSFDRDLLTDLGAAPVLALDELGSEKGNDASDATLFEMLGARYRRGRLTVIGTNLDAAQFKARYCTGAMERLYDRLRASGLWVNVPGESMRVSP
jgi:DNA replication protein DnaC